MKKHFIPLTALALMALVSCGGGNNPSSSASSEASQPASSSQTTQASEPSSEKTSDSSSEAVQYAVEIANKDALKADWHVSDADRAVELNLSPKTNITQAIADGTLTIVSSDPAVVQVLGRNLHAAAAGTATITVTYGDKTDSVEVSVIAKQTNKDKYGTTHEGTLEDPFDNTDAIKVGLWCKDNGNTPEELYVTGTVDSFYHAPGSRDDGAVSFFLSELVAGEGKFEVYKCYKSVNGEQVAIGESEIWKGATIVAHGIFTYYANGKQAETTSAILDSVTGEKPADPIDITANVAEAIEAGLKLADGDSTYDYYVVTGYVVKKSGNNFFLSDSDTLAEGTDDKQLLELFSISKDEDKALLTKGAKVTVKLHLKNYHSQIENSGAVTITLVTAGTPWEIQYTDATVAEALTVAKALEGGATTSAYYKVTGVVKEITGAWSAKYGNMNFTIADSADATETLTVYRLTVSEAKAATIVPGCTVVIGGQLQNYVKDSVSTYELIPSELFEVKDAGGQTVVNYGTLEAPLSVADLLGDDGTLCAQTNGSFSAQKVVVKGLLISAEYSDKYGTWTLVLADSKDGGTIKATGLHLKAEVAATIAANDTVIVEHYLEYYNGGYSLYYKKIDNVYDYGDVLSRVTIGTSVLTVEENEHATVTGLAESYKNDETATFTVTPAEGYEIVSVSVYGKDANVGEGGTYTVKVAGDGVIKVVVKETGTVVVVNYGTLEAPLSVADLLGDDGTLCAQTNGSFSAQKVVVKGLLISAEYSDKYGTWTLVLADSKDGGTIKATGLHLKAEVAATIAANDTVIVEHYLEYYNGGYSLYYKKIDNVYDYGDVLSRVTIGTSVLTVEENEHATVTGLAESYKNDETATFTVTPAEGYELVSVSVYGKVANPGEGGTYTVKVAGDGVIKIEVKEANAPAPSKVTWTADADTVAAFPAAYSATAAETGWDVVIGEETVTMNGANIKKNSQNGYYIMMGSKAQKAVSFFYNETAFARAITKVTITTGANASASAKYNVTFGADAAVAAAAEAGSGVTVANNTSQEFTPAEGVAAKYFQIASTNTNANGQIAKIEIEFAGSETPVEAVYTVNVGDAVTTLTKGDADPNGTTQYSGKIAAAANDELIFKLNGEAINVVAESYDGNNAVNSEGKVLVVTAGDALDVYLKVHTDGSYTLWLGGYKAA